MERSNQKGRSMCTLALAGIAICLLIGPAAEAGAGTLRGGSGQDQDAVRLFPQTGKHLAGRFLQYWDSNGGLMQFGYPISEVLQESSDLGAATHTVQYFERAVLELHPENVGTPYEVLLSRLGMFYYTWRYAGSEPDQAAQAGSDTLLFSSTDKHLGGTFLQYWLAHGGVPRLGYPISEEIQERSLVDGRTRTVQYFERAVLELHAENRPPYNVLQSLLGTWWWEYRSANCPGPVTNSLNGGTLLSEQVRSQLNQLAGHSDESGSPSDADMRRYAEDLEGKVLACWKGWVIATGPTAIDWSFRWSTGLTRSQAETAGLLTADNPQYVDRTATLLMMENPYAPPPTNKVPTLLRPIYVLLTRVGSGQTSPFEVGQQVSFSGAVAMASFEPGLGLYVPSPLTKLTTDRPASTIVAPDLQGAVVSLDRRKVGLSTRPEYSVTALGDGTVIFHGMWGTRALGARLWSISANKLRALIAESEVSGFFAMNDVYGSELPEVSVIKITISLPGRTKSVTRDDGYANPPRGLVELETMIDELLNTRPWVY